MTALRPTTRTTLLALASLFLLRDYVARAQCVEVEPNDQPAQATAVTIPGRFTGAAHDGDGFGLTIVYPDGTPDRVEDLFTFQLSAPTRVEIVLTFAGSGPDLDIYLFAPQGSDYRNVASSAGSGTTETIRPVDPLPAGRYYVGVSAYALGASYTLEIKVPGVAGVGPCATGGCQANATTLCLNGGRYKVQSRWATPDGRTGAGQAAALTADSGTFWFFDPANVEVLVKVLNGCSFNQRHWVFAAGLTNVRVVLTVTDTETGVAKEYLNPLDTPFQPIQDTSAFVSCPAGI